MKKIFFSYRKKDGYEDVFESDSVKQLATMYRNGDFPTKNIKNVAVNGRPAPAEVTTISQLLDLFPLQAPVTEVFVFERSKETTIQPA